MKKLKRYNIRKNYNKIILTKIVILTSTMISFISLTNFFWLYQFSTNILWKISESTLYENTKKLNFDWTIWPLKEITDLSDRTIRNSNMNYNQIREKTWSQISDNMKTIFPTKIWYYIDKYKNITLQKASKVFSNSDEYNEFTFMRRIIRATWIASYEEENIWKKDTWTHAWVDIMSNIWTPLYSISNGLVIEKKESNKWFGNYIAILIKVNNEYYIVFYWHMYSLNENIKIWDIIKKWENIWTIWSSWNSSTPHLHLQINKVFTLQDILNGKLMLWWYHNLNGVKEYTIDPIAFIEKYYNYGWDNLPNLNKNKQDINLWNSNNSNNSNISLNYQALTNENTKNNIKSIEEDDNDLIATISKKLEENTKTNQYATILPEKMYIKNIKLDLMDDKIQLWHSFNAILDIQPGNWTISIIASNTNLQLTKDKIEDPLKEQYTIQFLAKSLWETTITFNDWKSIHSYNIRIYKKETEDIYWIKVEVDNLNLLSDSKIIIYPTNKFWQILNTSLKSVFSIYLDINNNKELIQNIHIDGSKYVWYIRWNMYWKWKLIVSSDKFYFKTNIIVNIANDYSYDSSKYAHSMFELIKSWIIKWENGFLYPNKNITRKELLAIVARGIFKVNYDELKLQMQKYISKNGKFFKDVSGNWYFDPYIYFAWKENIIKWENNYSFLNNYVSKWELFTILTRLFHIKVKEDYLNFWHDLNSGTELKAIADTIKKYGLYEFQDYNSFHAWKYMSRLISFETLNNFLNYIQNNKYLSSDELKQDLNKEIDTIFEF